LPFANKKYKLIKVICSLCRPSHWEESYTATSQIDSEKTSRSGDF